MSYILPSTSRMRLVLLGPTANVSVGTDIPTLPLLASHADLSMVTSKFRPNVVPRVLIRCYPEICWWNWGSPWKTDNQDSHSLGRDSNRGPLEYRSGALPLRQPAPSEYSVFVIFLILPHGGFHDILKITKPTPASNPSSSPITSLRKLQRLHTSPLMRWKLIDPSNKFKKECR
jgi:hypothetical protein